MLNGGTVGCTQPALQRSRPLFVAHGDVCWPGRTDRIEWCPATCMCEVSRRAVRSPAHIGSAQGQSALCQSGHPRDIPLCTCACAVEGRRARRSWCQVSASNDEMLACLHSNPQGHGMCCRLLAWRREMAERPCIWGAYREGAMGKECTTHTLVARAYPETRIPSLQRRRVAGAQVPGGRGHDVQMVMG